MKRILILYSEVMGYTKACIDQLASDFNVEILMFQLDKLKLTPYEPDFRQKNVTFYNKSKFSYYKVFFKKCLILTQLLFLFLDGWMQIISEWRNIINEWAVGLYHLQIINGKVP